MNSPDWRQISSGAKAVVRGLLEVNRDQRMGMAELRSHPWLTEPLRVIERERFQNGDEGSRHGAHLFGGSYAEPDSDLMSQLNYLTRCVNWNYASSLPQPDGLCLFISTGKGQPAVVTVMMEHGGSVYVQAGVSEQLEMPLAMVSVTKAQVLKWLGGAGPLVAELPASGCSLKDFLMSL